MPARRKPPVPTEDCPHCGEPVKVTARACPHCGSDAETGWAASDEIEYQAVEIPDYWSDPDPDETTVFGMTVSTKKAFWLSLGMGLALVAAIFIAFWVVF